MLIDTCKTVLDRQPVSKRFAIRLILSVMLIALLTLPALSQAPSPSASATADSITVSWDGYSGSETHYYFLELWQESYLLLRIQLGSWERQFTIINDYMEVGAPQIQPNTDYKVTLAVDALRDFQHGGNTYQRYERMEASTMVRTAAGSGNSNTVPTLLVSITNIGSTAFTVNWSSIGEGAFFQIDVLQNGVFVANNFSETLSARIDWGLEPDTEYQVEVLGISETSPNFDWDRTVTASATVRTLA